VDVLLVVDEVGVRANDFDGSKISVRILAGRGAFLRKMLTLTEPRLSPRLRGRGWTGEHSSDVLCCGACASRPSFRSSHWR